MSIFESALAVFVASFALSGLTIFSSPLHAKWTLDPVRGTQKLHEGVALRVGGASIMVSMFLALLLLPRDSLIGPVFAGFIEGAMLVFLIGFVEDLSKRVSVTLRLLSALIASFWTIVLTQVSLTALGLGGWEENLLAFKPLSIAFTAFAIAGVTNAFNIIDGLNGLAIGAALLALAALGFIASAVGDQELFSLCLLLFASSLGFSMLNWPLGKIFLGDGGAYLLGFVIAWIAILLPTRNPGEVSPWVSLLVLFYPVMETLFTLVRRRVLRRHPVKADRLHMHTLLKKRVIPRLFPKRSLLTRNSLAGLLCAGLSLLPCIGATLFFSNQPALIALIALFTGAYILVYRRLVLFRWT